MLAWLLLATFAEVDAAEPGGPVASVAAESPAPRIARHQAGVMLSTALDPKYLTTTGAFGGYRFFLLDGLGVELAGGAFAGGHTKVLDDLLEHTGPGFRVTLPDGYRLQWTAGLSAIAAVLEGPVWISSVDHASELELIASLGVGVGGLSGIYDDTRTSAVINAGAGVKVGIIGSLLALRFELRDFFYADPGAAAARKAGSTLADDLTHSVQAQVGIELGLESLVAASETRAAGERIPIERWEIGARVGTSFADRYVSSENVGGVALMHLFDLLAIEASGNGFVGAQRERLSTGLLNDLKPPGADRAELIWNLGLALRSDLARGRTSLLGSGLTADLGIYVLAGGGLGQARLPCTPGLRLDPAFGAFARCRSINTANGEDANETVYEPNRLVGLGQLGAGILVGVGSALSISFEVRDLIFPFKSIQPEGPPDLQTSAVRNIVLAQLGLGAMF